MNDVIRSYNQEVANRNMAMELGARIQAHDERRMFQVGSDTVVAEIEVPPWMIGKTLGDINLRSTYNVSVFIIKESHQRHDVRIVTPGVSYEFTEHSTLLVGGKKEDIHRVIRNNP